MAIGEFGGAPSLLGDGGVLFSAPMYWFYEMNQAALNPSRAMADATKLLFKNPLNPLTTTMFCVPCDHAIGEARGTSIGATRACTSLPSSSARET